MRIIISFSIFLTKHPIKQNISSEKILRHFILFLLVVLLTSINSFSQQSPWQWVSPLPQGNILNAVWTIDLQTIVAAGGYGTIIKTTNAGTTWQVQSSVTGFTGQFLGIRFVSPSIGWAVGEQGVIVKTTDGGVSWSTQDLSTIETLFSLHFTSETTGWITGTSGVIFKTTNGGQSWTAQTSGTSSTLFSIHFISGTTGYAVGFSGTILKTTSGGSTWNLITAPTSSPLYSIQFTSSTTGWIVGSFGTILKTLNGGTTWSPVSSGTSLSLYAVQFPTSSIGWAVGLYGTMIKTTDGGASWAEQPKITSIDLYSISFVSSSIGMMVGDFGTIIKTTDSGTTWTQASSSPRNEIYAFHFPTTTTGWAVGDLGTILKTTDAGVSWIQQSSQTWQSLYGVYFVNPSLGWVVGDSAVILRTTNGGSTWNDQNSRTDLALNSIHFVDQSAGWAVGDFGTILATTNSGLTWTMQTSNTTQTLLKTKFSSRQIGWAVGSQGTIIKTTNSGVTWFTQPSGTTSTINSIDVIDASTLYVVGDLGAILSSTNGGLTWTQQTSGFDTDLYGVAFTSLTTGWAVGEDGKIIHTNNNGSTWSLQNSGTLNFLFDVFIIKSGAIGKAFAAGVGGTILCSGISPLPVRTWTGVIDSLWNRPENWIPTGVPEKLDSVIIQQAPSPAYIQNTQQQMNLSALTINTGARLRIGPLLSQLVIQSNINVNGIFQIDSDAFTQILIGKNFIVNPSGRFSPGHSSVIILGNGQIRGSFYNLKTSEDASAQSLGNIYVTNLFTPQSDFFLRPSDTLSILNPKGYAIEGQGVIGTGTIKRAIMASSTERYQFESQATFIQFEQTGILPDTVLVTTYPNTPTPGLPSSLFVKRSYFINAKGGSNYRASLSLRYEPSETIIPLEDLVLFRDSSGILSNMGKSNTLNSDYVAVILDSIKHLSSWYLGHKNYIPRHPYEFIDTLIITDSGLNSDTVFFGVKDGATAGLDTPLGEFELSPKPPSGFLDARWIIPSTNGTQVDILEKLNQEKTENSYLLVFQPSISGYPITFHWNNEILPIGSFFLRDHQSLGGLFNVNMRLENTKTITDSSMKSVEIIQKAPTYYAVKRGWNIVSLPLNSTTDKRKVNVFTTAISEAFGYNNSYFLAETLSTGRGYWLKYLNNHTIALEGTPLEVDTIDITTGWNMIGSITRPVAITTIVQNPPNTISGNIYSFTSGYTITDSILPAKGYWLKANNNGKLIISASALQSTSQLKQSASDFLNQSNSITIRDNDGNSQSLYFGTSNIPMTSAEYFELPPPPPQGIFDARFRSGNLLELLNDNRNQEIFIDISSHFYPLQVQTRMISPSVSVILKVDNKEIHILPAKPLTILNPISHIALIVSTATGYPTKYHLDQNYPNPFNPRTIIRYQLPEDSKVVLKIYNVLGQEVKTLVDEIQEMGFKETDWKSTNSSGYFLPSGVYLYRLEASSLITPGKVFTEVKKMLLIR